MKECEDEKPDVNGLSECIYAAVLLSQWAEGIKARTLDDPCPVRIVRAD